MEEKEKMKRREDLGDIQGEGVEEGKERMKRREKLEGGGCIITQTQTFNLTDCITLKNIFTFSITWVTQV